MNSEPDITEPIVVVPCFNEQERIGSVVRSIRQSLPNSEIVVVNDASTDGSMKEAKEAGAVVLPHACNLGYGGALETGYLYAGERGHRILLQMDGDGQHSASDFKKLLDPLIKEEADIVIGSRYRNDAATSHKVPLSRKLGHGLFSIFIFLLTGNRLSDPTSGFQALGPRAVELFSSGIFPCDYPDSDVILIAHLSGLRIIEIPVNMHSRTGGKSMHSGIKPFYYSVKMLFSMFIVLLNFRKWSRWRKELQNGL